MRKGFTLLELLIVVIIIGILATFAIPQYLKAVERAKGSKARHNMSLISEAEKMYRADNDTYLAAGDTPGTTDLNDYVELLDVDADDDWNYAISDLSAFKYSGSVRTAGFFVSKVILVKYLRYF